MIPRKLNCVLDLQKLKQHFYDDVVGDDRRLRFGGIVKNEYIDEYIDFPKSSDMWFVVEDKEKIVATCHVAYDKHNNLAELGLTVSADYRNQKLGQQLFDRGVTWARMMGAESVFMHCLSENHIVQQIARKSGMAVVTYYPSDESEASMCWNAARCKLVGKDIRNVSFKKSFERR